MCYSIPNRKTINRMNSKQKACFMLIYCSDSGDYTDNIYCTIISIV